MRSMQLLAAALLDLPMCMVIFEDAAPCTDACVVDMKDALLKYAAQFVHLDEEETRAIVEDIPLETYPMGTILLHEGEVSSACYFILKGCIRQYHLIDGVEKTTGFFTELQAVVNFTSFAQQVPSKHYFACVEETTAVVGRPDAEAEMYQKFPKFAAMSRAMMEQDFGKTQEAMANFITSSPEERYLGLLQTRPELLQRVPQHQLASYLGVTPESLSRIRKRIAQRK